jgi:8-oxo-dGTP diphosphatase
MGRPVIEVVTAVIHDGESRVLVVRKRGTAVFMKPGGKREPGEDDLTALAREIGEELGCRLVEATRLGEFEAPAANEPGTAVRASVYLARVGGAIEPGAEIEEIAWIDARAPGSRRLAPLLVDAVLPALVLAPSRADLDGTAARLRVARAAKISGPTRVGDHSDGGQDS